MATNPLSSDRTIHTVENVPSHQYRPLLIAGLVLGLGQGGFFDGIVFHQLLQWHHMFSSIETDMTIAGMELNTFGDGLFHLLDWLLTLTGIFLLWRAGRWEKEVWSGRFFSGALLLGAGSFNLIEGILNHHILGIHHLKPGVHQLLWDLGFLASGVLFISIGLLLMRTGKKSQIQH
jgi:uncharacterized membrane protein